LKKHQRKQKKMKKTAKPVRSKDFLEETNRQQKELDESMKESFKQRDERRRTESEKLQEELEPINE